MAEPSKEDSKYEPFVAIDIGSYSVKFVYVEQGDDNAFILKTLANIVVPPYEKIVNLSILEFTAIVLKTGAKTMLFLPASVSDSEKTAFFSV